MLKGPKGIADGKFIVREKLQEEHYFKDCYFKQLKCERYNMYQSKNYLKRKPRRILTIYYRQTDLQMVSIDKCHPETNLITNK